MKTYWLEGRDPPGRAVQSVQEEETDEMESPQSEDGGREVGAGRDLEDDRRVYSPVTFQEIAKRSLASSPKRISGQCQYSMPHVFSIMCECSRAEYRQRRMLWVMIARAAPPAPLLRLSLA